MDDYESVLLVIKECFVYRIPTRTSARGYKASDWDVNQFMWKGRLRVIAKGDACSINLEVGFYFPSFPSTLITPVSQIISINLSLSLCFKTIDLQYL
jgi:hypothetical protein